MKNTIYALFVGVITLISQHSFSQKAQRKSFEAGTELKGAHTFFIGYDFGEAAFNRFQSLGSEVGIRFQNGDHFRLSYTNLKLTEEHLSSNFASAVDGENIRGKQQGLELFYDLHLPVKDLYIGPSIGFYDNRYNHTLLKEKIRKSSFTMGAAVSYSQNLFKSKWVYYRVSVPIRYTFNPIEETKLGAATIKSNRVDNNIWFFIGLRI